MTKTTRTKRKGNKRLVLVIILAVLVVLAATFMLLFCYYSSNLKAVGDDSTDIAFVIEEGSSSSTVIQKLYDGNLIRDVNAAKIYVKLHNISSIYAGNYLLNKTMSVKEIFDTVTDEHKAIVEQVEVTLLPGKWAKDFAAAIADKTNLTAEEILAKWNDIDYMYTLIDKYDFLTTDIFLSEHVYLEGYLMPDTYYFYSNTTVEQVTAKILDQTEVIYKKYESEIADTMAAKKISIHDVFTLASVVMFEANSEESMKMVAGIFFNRLAQGMKMQSSVTVCYALYDDYHTWQDCETHPDIDSKYNTYKYEGLPVGPICNPTETAIKAVLEPTSSDYLYFMASTVSGTMHYAKTYAEHEKNVSKYLYK